MLRRKAKRRYLAIMHSGQATEAVDSVIKRCSELFGSVAATEASIRLMKSSNATIIRCRLDQLDSVLAAIALTSPPVVTLGMSGSVKHLKSRIAETNS